MKTKATALVVWALLFFSTVQSQEPAVKWLFPRRQMTFRTLDVVNVTYESPYEDPYLYTFCGNGSAAEYKNSQWTQPYNGWVLVGLGFTSDDNCWFNLRPGRAANGSANSNYFRVNSEPRQNETVVGLGGVEALTTALSDDNGKTTPNTTTSTTAIPATPDTAPPGLSTAAKAGIGVAAAVGGIVVLGLVFYAGWRLRGSQRARGSEPAEHGSQAGLATEEVGQSQPGGDSGKSAKSLHTGDDTVAATPASPLPSPPHAPCDGFDDMHMTTAAAPVSARSELQGDVVEGAFKYRRI